MVRSREGTSATVVMMLARVAAAAGMAVVVTAKVAMAMAVAAAAVELARLRVAMARVKVAMARVKVAMAGVAWPRRRDHHGPILAHSLNSPAPDRTSPRPDRWILSAAARHRHTSHRRSGHRRSSFASGACSMSSHRLGGSHPWRSLSKRRMTMAAMAD